jgi:hypothetical protein
MPSRLINSLLLKLHCKHNNNQTIITTLSVLRGFSACFKWRWNVEENTSKFYSIPLALTALLCLLLCSPACYFAPSLLLCHLPVTAFSYFNFSLSLLQKFYLIRSSCLFSSLQHCECNRLWLYRFVQFALNSERSQKINEEPKRIAMTLWRHHYLLSAHCSTCSNVLHYSAVSCNCVTERSLCLCS